MMLNTKYQGSKHGGFTQEDFIHVPYIKVKRKAKTGNRCKQVPYLTRNTIWESEKKNNTTELRGQPFPSK